MMWDVTSRAAPGYWIAVWMVYIVPIVTGDFLQESRNLNNHQNGLYNDNLNQNINEHLSLEPGGSQNPLPQYQTVPNIASKQGNPSPDPVPSQNLFNLNSQTLSHAGAPDQYGTGFSPNQANEVGQFPNVASTISPGLQPPETDTQTPQQQYDKQQDWSFQQQVQGQQQYVSSHQNQIGLPNMVSAQPQLPNQEVPQQTVSDQQVAQSLIPNQQGAQFLMSNNQQLPQQLADQPVTNGQVGNQFISNDNKSLDQQSRQQLLNLLRQRYEKIKAQQLADQKSGLAPSVSIPSALEQKIKYLLGKTMAHHEDTQNLLEKVEKHFPTDIVNATQPLQQYEESSYLQHSVSNTNQTSFLSNTTNVGQSSSDSLLNSLNATAIDMLTDNKGLQNALSNFTTSPQRSDLMNQVQAFSGYGNNSTFVPYETRSNLTSGKDDMETNDDSADEHTGPDDAEDSSEEIDEYGQKTSMDTSENYDSSNDLKSVLESTAPSSDKESAYVIWDKARQNYLRSPVSMLVIYSWLAVIIVAIIGILTVIKKGHKLLITRRDISHPEYRHDTIHITEDGRSVRRSVEVY